MKVKLLPLAIGAAIAIPGVAMAETNFYGKINLAYGMQDSDYGYNTWDDDDNGATPEVDFDPNSADRWVLNSYDSRFGVKGAEDINDSLSVIYGIEWGVSIDGDSDEMTQRNRFVGLEGGFGQFKAGRFDTPLKAAQGKVDLFGDTTGDIKYVFVGENRVDDILQYQSPSLAGFVATAAWIPGEEFEANGNNDADDGPADAYSVSLAYNVDNLYVAVAQDMDVPSRAYIGVDTDLELTRSGSAEMDVTRLVGVFKMDAFQLGAIYQMAEISDTDRDGDLEQDGYLVSGSFKLDAIKLKAQVGMTTLSDNDTNEDLDAELVALGADYVLSKQTNFYVHYTMASYEGDEDGAEEQTSDQFDLGIIHKF